MGEYIGIDVYGREIYLSHACNRVYCKHVKNGKVVRTNSVEVSSDIVMMFGARRTSGAYIYDEIYRRYRKKL